MLTLSCVGGNQTKKEANFMVHQKHIKMINLQKTALKLDEILNSSNFSSGIH